MPRVAAIDIGSNSTRLLVADVREGKVDELLRKTEITRLAEGVDASGRLAEAAMNRVIETIRGFIELIDQRGADEVVAAATSAVRDSDNRDEFISRLHERFGLELQTISGDEEAALTFLGATSLHPGAGNETLVIDIGGGSTEFVTGRAGAQPDFHVSTQSGAVRQTERHLHDDPPSKEQLETLREEVRQIVLDAVPEHVRASVSRAIAVAGTATSLAAIEQRLEPYDPSRVDGYHLRRAGCEEMLGTLARMPVEQRRGVPGLNPKRAPTIVAGAAILAEAIGAFALEEVLTSEADILYGLALRASGVAV